MSGWGVGDIPDQQGRTVIVTGANGGLGAAAARALAGAGAQVILACRNVDKGHSVAAAIGERARVQHVDLADLSSIRAFAAEVDDAHVLINNAGVMAVPLRRTVDGFEMQMGTNHLGHFALTGLLLGKISERIVTVSSGAHTMGVIDLDDLNWEHRPYKRWSAYGQSKLANLLFSFELQRRLAAAGSAKLAVAAHPGYAATGLQSHTESIMDKVMALGNKLAAQSAEMGALPELFAATAPVEPGAYYGPTALGGSRGHPGPSGCSKRAKDQLTARSLWDLSERLTGVKFDFTA